MQAEKADPVAWRYRHKDRFEWWSFTRDDRTVALLKGADFIVIEPVYSEATIERVAAVLHDMCRHAKAWGVGHSNTANIAFNEGAKLLRELRPDLARPYYESSK